MADDRIDKLVSIYKSGEFWVMNVIDLQPRICICNK